VRYRQSIAVVSYLAASAVWVYYLLDRQVFFGNPAGDLAILGAVALVHVGSGYAVGRWWALSLALLPSLMAIPLGYPSTNLGEPLPIWQGLLGWAPVGMVLIAVGVGMRRLGPRSGGQISSARGNR
jgi:hypothetical protein